MKKIKAALVAAALLAGAHANAQGVLESPPTLGVESGIGVIRGWHCTSRNIEVFVDGAFFGNAGTGTPRADTAATCGRSDTGYSLLYNYALLKGGTHRVDVRADGVLFGSSTFTAGYAGAEYMTGLKASHEVPDFPVPGSKARLAWNESKQNFVITDVRSEASGAIAGSYLARDMTISVSTGGVMSSLQSGVSLSGSGTFNVNGTYSMMLTLTVNGVPDTEAIAGTWSDMGHYLLLDGAPAPLLERGETLTFDLLSPSATGWMSGIFSLARGASGGMPTKSDAPLEARQEPAVGLPLRDFFVVAAARP